MIIKKTRKGMRLNGTFSIDQLARIIADNHADYLATGSPFTRPEHIREFMKMTLAGRAREIMAVMYLDNKHRLIEYREEFSGTISSAQVHPREIVRSALELNAAAVILAHNHPSGDCTPSDADKNITRKLVDALALVDVRTLDHFIFGAFGRSISFAEKGLL